MWIALLLPALACGAPEPEVAEAPAPTVVPVPRASAPRPTATLEIAEFGTIEIELFSDLAPKTVDNFVKLARDGFYIDTTFHRVIPEFAIQGGDPNTRDRDPRNDGHGGPGYTIEDEFSAISHVRGIVSMANKGHAGTAGSQFFIVVNDALPLDGKYAVFGRVIRGMDVVDAISRVPRDQYGRHGPPDRPTRDVRLAAISVHDLRTELAATPEETASRGLAQETTSR